MINPAARSKIPTAFHMMVKPRGAMCNLDCQYCFYLRKEALYPGGTFRMNDELLESYTRQYLEAQHVPEVTFAWQGGEPTLMGLDFYEKAVALQRKYRQPGVKIHNSFQTNGVLLNEAWCQFLREHGFLVGISLDGPAHLHDAYRVDKGGQPTFERVMQAVSLLKQQRVEFNLLACVNDRTAEFPLEVYHFLRDEAGAQFIQFIPIVERGEAPNQAVSARSVNGKAFGDFMIAIFDEWVRRDVGKVYVQHFDVALAAWAGFPAGLCVHAETCGLALALEHNGDVYACDHFVEPAYRLGNILEDPLEELVGLPQQQRFGSQKKTGLPSYCRKCTVRFACHGGCPKDRLLHTPQGEPELNILCEGYKVFFMHIDGPMKLMARYLKEGKPPAQIMERLASPGRRRRKKAAGSRE